MIVEVDKDRINANLIIFDTVSFQVWGKEDGKMVLDMPANNIKKIIVVTEE